MTTEIYFSPKTQFENVGDALINVQLCELASNCGQLNLDLSRCPPEFKESFDEILARSNVRSLSSFLIMLLKIVNQLLKGNVCYLFLSPGGYVGEISPASFAKKSAYDLLLLLLSKFGLRVCLFGVSYERLGRLHVKHIKYRSKILYAHVLRDQMSASYADKYKLRYTKISLDLALSLNSADDVEKNISYDLCVAFRCDQYDDQLNDVVDTLLRFLGETNQAGSSYRLLMASQVRRDDANLVCIKERVCKKFPDIRIDTIEINNFKFARKTYARSSVVISNRLHVILAAGSVETRVFAVCHDQYNQKLIGILNDLGATTSLLRHDSKFLEIDFLQKCPVSDRWEENRQVLNAHFASLFR